MRKRSLAIATSKGILTFANNGEHGVRLYEERDLVLPDDEESSSSAPIGKNSVRYFRGLAYSHKKTKFGRTLFVGTSQGDVLVFREDNGSLTLRLKLRASKTPISTVCASVSSGILAAGSTSGQISVWRLDDLVNVGKVIRKGSSCMSLQIRKKLVMAAFSSGQIRVYSCASGVRLVAEIAAHVRCITALALHPQKDWLASVSEDTAINVWSFSGTTSDDTADDDDDLEIRLIFSKVEQDAVFTAVGFRGDDLVSMSYDRSTLFVYKRCGK